MANPQFIQVALVLMTFLGSAKPYTIFESKKSRSALQWSRSRRWSSHWDCPSCCWARFGSWRGRGDRERLWRRWRLLEGVLDLGGLLDRPRWVRDLWEGGWRWLRCMAAVQDGEIMLRHRCWSKTASNGEIGKGSWLSPMPFLLRF